jgi:pimeloyl-ACP methyl ester carboxylesterase
MISEPVPFTASDGVRREAIATRPLEAGNRCAVLLVHGLATPARRTEDPTASRLAHDLADLGFQVVRYVPRLLCSPQSDVDFHMELADARGALSLTRGLALVDEVFLLGLSLGGIAAPLAAGPGLSGLASWGSTARPWPEYIAGTIRIQLGFRRLEPERIESHARTVERWFTMLRSTDADGEALLEALPGASRYGIDARAYQGRSVRFWRQLVQADFRDSYRGLDCPVLAVRGGADCASHPEDHRSILDAARAAGLEAEGIVLDGIDHAFRPCSGPESSFLDDSELEPDCSPLARAFAAWVDGL